MKYRVVNIPKTRRTYRSIYIADRQMSEALLSHIPYLESVMIEQDEHAVAYAFIKGRNCALNALRHVGYNYTLSMDVKNFFPSIKPSHVYNLLPTDVIEECFIDGAPQQGLPTSPLIANIAFSKCDATIIRILDALDITAVYTRYADDLIFSFNKKNFADSIVKFVEATLQRFGFHINHKKTKLQCARNGRRIITGIGVDDEGIHASRRTKKRLRAANHQSNLSSSRGLLEWSKCKIPNSLRSTNE